VATRQRRALSWPLQSISQRSSEPASALEEKSSERDGIRLPQSAGAPGRIGRRKRRTNRICAPDQRFARRARRCCV